MSYDIKFRKRTIEYLEKGHSYRETAKIFRVSLMTTWVKKYRTTGSLEDTPVKRRRQKIDSEALKAYVRENPDLYQSEMAEHFSCSQQAICRALKRDKITLKKIKRFKEQNPDKVKEYLQVISQIPKDKLAYVDETGIDSYLYREHCYAERGKTVTGRISGKKYRRTGIVAAKMQKGILAPLQYDGTMDSILFETWFAERLLPDLPTDSVVVLDNASFHRKGRLQAMAQSKGDSVIFLPPYSPELNLLRILGLA